MDIPRNTLIPVLGTIGLVIAGTVIYSHFRDDPAPVPPPASARPADGDNANETLTTVVASNGELRKQIQAVLDQNANLKRDNDALRTSQEAVAAQAREQVLAQLRAEGVVGASAVPGAADVTPVDPAAPPAKRTPLDRVGSAVDQAINDAGTLLGSLKTTPAGAQPAASHGIPAGLGYDGATALPSTMEGGGVTTYKVVAPLGYDESKEGHEKKLVRKTVGAVAARHDAGVARTMPAEPAVLAATDGEEATPYFTIPENATMTRVTAMTAIVGRVPIDGRVTDPMQFKAIIGRENLAANGWDMPDDLSGIVVSGIAIGDMALSCSEGKIHSLTFVFADGSIRTVSNRKKSGGGGGASGDRPLGYISDPWGNPCIAGRFVTNAPAYLTDVVGLRTLGVASRAYAASQTTTTDSAQTGTSSTSVTGDRGAYVLGQAAAAGTDEVTNWVMSRLKNSFDAVVTPAGQKVVLHIDQQIDIDKAADARKLDHGRTDRFHTAFGDRHGLD